MRSSSWEPPRLLFWRVVNCVSCLCFASQNRIAAPERRPSPRLSAGLLRYVLFVEPILLLVARLAHTRIPRRHGELSERATCRWVGGGEGAKPGMSECKVNELFTQLPPLRACLEMVRGRTVGTKVRSIQWYTQ